MWLYQKENDDIHAPDAITMQEGVMRYSPIMKGRGTMMKGSLIENSEYGMYIQTIAISETITANNGDEILAK